MSDDGLNFGMSDGRIVITKRFRGDDALGGEHRVTVLTHPEKFNTRSTHQCCGMRKFVWYFTDMLFQPPAKDRSMTLPRTCTKIELAISIHASLEGTQILLMGMGLGTMSMVLSAS